MLQIFDTVRDFTIFSVALRILATCISAGLIGYERGLGGRAAGLRTHILVSLGACVVMCVDQYLVTVINSNADPARLGAQVINGIGFLGAGTIMATGKRVTGLTTASGLWTTACVGLAFGCGYFEGGILATITMLIVLVWLHKVEGHTSTLVGMELLLEIEKSEDIPCLLKTIKLCGLKIVNITINDPPKGASRGHLEVRLSLRVGRNFDASHLLDELAINMPVVKFEEL